MANSEYYGSKDKAFVRAKQKELGVKVDGIWGPKTEAAYQKSLTAQNTSTAPAATALVTPTLNIPTDDDLRKQAENIYKPALDSTLAALAAQKQEAESSYGSSLEALDANRTKSIAEMTQNVENQMLKRGFSISTMPAADIAKYTGEIEGETARGRQALTEKLLNARSAIAANESAAQNSYGANILETMRQLRQDATSTALQQQQLAESQRQFDKEFALKEMLTKKSSGGGSPKGDITSAMAKLKAKKNSQKTWNWLGGKKAAGGGGGR